MNKEMCGWDVQVLKIKVKVKINNFSGNFGKGQHITNNAKQQIDNSKLIEKEEKNNENNHEPEGKL
ncbi:hypothetical protein DERP_000699 [Dermatophagoides pteronyssinus]|uniref:Uncharacterized protein n=1 Tax=Dermatophagoides pteronyssinus TaxID=6956 RepID=A0ABQ8J125_DERPT|nr:hypothetical protein DERP_000699 [Dermatophagoides pteronyssinus]